MSDTKTTLGEIKGTQAETRLLLSKMEAKIKEEEVVGGVIEEEEFLDVDPTPLIYEKMTNMIEFFRKTLPPSFKTTFFAADITPNGMILSKIAELLIKLQIESPGSAGLLTDLDDKWNVVIENNELKTEEKYSQLREGLDEIVGLLKEFTEKLLGFKGQQKKDFTTWVNKHLKSKGVASDDMVNIEVIYRIIRYIHFFNEALMIQEQTKRILQAKK